MTRRRGILLAVIALLLVTGIAVRHFQAPLGLMLAERVIAQRVGSNRLTELQDGLHVALCGTGSPMPDRSRAEACTTVIAGQHIFVVDSGEGGARTMQVMGIPMGRIERVFLTHFHSDHIDGLENMMLLRWTAASSTSPLPIAGPEGVEAIVSGYNAAFATDNRLRTLHHGPQVVPPSGAGGVPMPFPAPAKGQSVIVYAVDGVTVTAFSVDHGPITPAVGYRFDYKGRSVVISGDTAFSPSLVRAARGADLIVHEALQPDIVNLMNRALAERGVNNTAQIMEDILNYHATPEQAADSARLAGARALLISHLIPPVPSRFIYPAFLGDAASHFSGPITVGEDGMVAHLPAGQTNIEWNNWLP